MSHGPAIIRAALGAWRHAGSRRHRIAAYQDELLRRLVRHAYANVPYYRARWAEAGVTPDRIRGVADLALLPISTKADFRARGPEEVLARGYDPARLLTVRTTGSSGVPFSLHRTAIESAVQYLFRIRAGRQFGRFFGRVAVVGVDWPEDPNDTKLGGRLLEAIGFSRVHGIDGLDDPATVVAELREWRPEVIVAMPGVLSRAAEYLLQHDIRDVRPQVVVVGGEVLTSPLRKRLAQAFGTRVFETYGSQEVPLLAWECREGHGLHVCDDGVVLEILRDGRPAEPGERGDVVVTNLHAYAMPFIRYRLTDIATRGETPCACGQPFSTIRAVDGREFDRFPLPDGRVVHPYHILWQLPDGYEHWIAQYQIVQERRDRIEFRVVPARPDFAAPFGAFEQAVQRTLGDAASFAIVVVDTLPLEPTGKFRPARSLVALEETGKQP